MSQKKPTQRDLDLLAMPSIASQLPVCFENKTAWHEFVGECRGCNQPIPDEHLRGAVTRPAQRPYERGVADMETEAEKRLQLAASTLETNPLITGDILMPISTGQAALLQQLRDQGYVVLLVEPSETEHISRERLESRLRADAADHIEDLLSLEAVRVR
ncbi:hypothetical protein L1887_47372 [Cichorium endivia]|nr:hypothetical protein L1887_47372 [Cichorium endivia]